MALSVACPFEHLLCDVWFTTYDVVRVKTYVMLNLLCMHVMVVYIEFSVALYLFIGFIYSVG